MGGWSQRHAFRADLGRHQTLRPRSKAHQHELTRPQFDQAEAAQGFYVHENVGPAFTLGEESETPQSIEPLDLGSLEATHWRDRDVRARQRHFRWVHRR